MPNFFNLVLCCFTFFIICLNAAPCSCTKNKQQKSQPCLTCSGHGEIDQDTKDLHKTICRDCGGIGFRVKHCECKFAAYVVGQLSEEQARKAVRRLIPYLERYNKTKYSKYCIYCEGEIKEAACSIFTLREHAKWALPTVTKTIKKMAREMAKKPRGYYGVDPYLQMAKDKY